MGPRSPTSENRIYSAPRDAQLTSPRQQSFTVEEMVEQVAPAIGNETVTLHVLDDRPSLTDCPLCGHRVMTIINYETKAELSYESAILHCLNGSIFDILCCTGFLDSGKDVVHLCGHCGNELAKWFRGTGTTVVLADPSRMHETTNSVALP